MTYHNFARMAKSEIDPRVNEIHLTKYNNIYAVFLRMEKSDFIVIKTADYKEAYFKGKAEAIKYNKPMINDVYNMSHTFLPAPHLRS